MSSCPQDRTELLSPCWITKWWCRNSWLTALAALIVLMSGVTGCAAVRSTRASQPKIEHVPARQALFVAGKRSKIYHRRDCPYAANLESLVGFNKMGDAEGSGHIPCEFCAPRTGEGTK